MEEWRDDFSTRHGIHLRAALVLVSVFPDFNSERHHHRLSADGLDVIARNDRRAKCLPRDRLRMASFRNLALGISIGGLGRETLLRKRVLRGRHGGLRTNRSDRKFCRANIRWWTTVRDKRTTGRNGIRLVSKAYTKQNGYILWAYL